MGTHEPKENLPKHLEEAGNPHCRGLKNYKILWSQILNRAIVSDTSMAVILQGSVSTYVYTYMYA